jgi:chromosome segregation ATPase
MDNTTYQQIIGEIGTLISIFAPLLTAYKLALAFGFDKYIESKINLIKDDNLRKVAENIKTRVENLTVDTITMLEAVEKPIIVQGIKDGSMTRNDLVGLKSKAIETIKNQLTTQGQTDLQNSVGDVNTYIDTLIEAKLADLKVDSTSSVSKTEIAMPTKEELDNAELTNKLSQVQTQLQQVQSEKDNLSQQVNQITNDKTNMEQINQQLSSQVNNLNNQNQSLSQQVQDLTNRLNTITSTFNSIVQSPTTQPQPVVDNTVQPQTLADNTVVLNTIQ